MCVCGVRVSLCVHTCVIPKRGMGLCSPLTCNLHAPPFFSHGPTHVPCGGAPISSTGQKSTIQARRVPPLVRSLLQALACPRRELASSTRRTTQVAPFFFKRLKGPKRLLSRTRVGSALKKPCGVKFPPTHKRKVHGRNDAQWHWLSFTKQRSHAPVAEQDCTHSSW